MPPKEDLLQNPTEQTLKGVLSDMAKAASVPPPERTNNGKGSMFYNISESASHWVSSLPSSPLPLLDIGAAYGVHTLYAMRHARDVLALDCDHVHLEELTRRVENLVEETPSEERKALGKLVGTVFATLPDRTALQDESVSGVLLSEVIHFLRPGEPLRLFEDVFQWLQPGGKVIVTAGSFPPRAGTFLKRDGISLWKGRSKEEALECYDLPDDEMVEAAPGFIVVSEDSALRKLLGEHLYLFSVAEMEALCRLVGFIVEKAKYAHLGKYPTIDPVKEPETVLLVARKPTDGEE